MKDYKKITLIGWLTVLAVVFVMSLFSSCMVYEYTPNSTKHSCELMDRGQSCLSDHSCCKEETNDITYWKTNYSSTVGLYYYNNNPYWGYSTGYYYYYGSRHVYPWWYYYNSIPPYYYGASTHVYCHLGNSGYVYRPRGNWRHNNKTNLTYNHNKVHTTGVRVKNKSNVPNKFRNTTRNNTSVIVTPNRNTKVKTNTNYFFNNVKTNTNRSNTKTNIKTNNNRSNKTNRTNIKINNNKSNIRTNNRSTKSNVKSPR